MSFYLKNGLLGEIEEFAVMPEDGVDNMASTTSAIPRRRPSYTEWEKMRKSKRKNKKKLSSCFSRSLSDTSIKKSLKKHHRTESQKEQRRLEKSNKRDSVYSNYFVREERNDVQRLSRKEVLSCVPRRRSKSKSSKLTSASPNRYQTDSKRKSKTTKDALRNKSRSESRESPKHKRKHAINSPNVTFIRVPRANSQTSLQRKKVKSPVMDPAGTKPRRQSQSPPNLNPRPTKQNRFSMFWCFGAGNQQHKREREVYLDDIPTRDVDVPRRKSVHSRRKKSYRHISEPPKYKLGEKYDYYSTDVIDYDPETEVSESFLDYNNSSEYNDFKNKEVVLRSENLNLNEKGSYDVHFLHQPKQNDRPRKSDGLMHDLQSTPSSHVQDRSKIRNYLATSDPFLREIASCELRTMRTSQDTDKCISDNILTGGNMSNNRLEHGFSYRREENGKKLNEQNVDLLNQCMPGSRNIFGYEPQTKDDIIISENVQPVSSFLKKVIDHRRIYPEEYYRPRSIDLGDTVENLFPNNTNIFYKKEISTSFFHPTDENCSSDSILRIIDTNVPNVKSDGIFDQSKNSLLHSREHSIDEANHVKTIKKTHKENNMIVSNLFHDSNYKSKISNNIPNKSRQNYRTESNNSKVSKYTPIFGGNLTGSTGRNPNIYNTNSVTRELPKIIQINGFKPENIEKEVVIKVHDFPTGSNIYDISLRNNLKRTNPEKTGKPVALTTASNRSVYTQVGGSVSHCNSSQIGLSRNFGKFSIHSNETDRTTHKINESNATQVSRLSYQNKDNSFDGSTLKKYSSTMETNREHDKSSMNCISENVESGISTRGKTSVFSNRTSSGQSEGIFSFESGSSRITGQPSPFLNTKTYKDRISSQESPIRQINTRRSEELNPLQIKQNSVVHVESISNQNESNKGKRLYKNGQAVPYKNEYNRRSVDRTTVNSNALGCFDDVGVRMLDSPVDSNSSGFRQRLVFTVDSNGDEYVRTVYQPTVSNMFIHRGSEYKQAASPCLSHDSPKSSTLVRFGQHSFLDEPPEILPVKMVTDNSQTFELPLEQREIPDKPQSNNRSSVASNASVIIGMAYTKDENEKKLKPDHSLPNMEFQDHIDPTYSSQMQATQNESKPNRDKLDTKSKTSNRKQKDLDTKQSDLDTKQSDSDAEQYRKQIDVDSKQKDLDTKQSASDSKQKDLDTKQSTSDTKPKSLNRRPKDVDARKKDSENHHRDVVKKEAIVSCKCGEKYHFTVAVEGNDKKMCIKCYQKIRKEFTELLNDYKRKGFVPCGCKGDISITDLVEGYMKEEPIVCTCARPMREQRRKRGSNSDLSGRSPRDHGRKDHDRHHTSEKCARNKCGHVKPTTLGQKMIHNVFQAMGGGEMNQDLKGTLTDGFVSCRCGDRKSVTLNELSHNVIMCRCNNGELRVNPDFVSVVNCCCEEKVAKPVVENIPTPVSRRRSRRGQNMPPACMSEEAQVYQQPLADSSKQCSSFRFKRSSGVAVLDKAQNSNRRLKKKFK